MLFSSLQRAPRPSPICSILSCSLNERRRANTWQSRVASVKVRSTSRLSRARIMRARVNGEFEPWACSPIRSAQLSRIGLARHQERRRTLVSGSTHGLGRRVSGAGLRDSLFSAVFHSNILGPHSSTPASYIPPPPPPPSPPPCSGLVPVFSGE